MCLCTVLPNLPFIIFVKGISSRIPTKTSEVRHAKERIKRLQGGFHFMIRSDKHFPRCKRHLAVKNYCFLPKLKCFSLFIIDSTNNQRALDIIYIYTEANVYESTSRTRLNLVSFTVLKGLEMAPRIFSCQLLKIQTDTVFVIRPL